jgi:hypothetical protein
MYPCRTWRPIARQYFILISFRVLYQILHTRGHLLIGALLDFRYLAVLQRSSKLYRTLKITKAITTHYQRKLDVAVSRSLRRCGRSVWSC